MKTFDPKELNPMQVQNYLQSAIGPRPIALASTIDANGNHNLSPFSFFNIFSSNPPVLIFSPARRVRNSTTKHTLENVKEIKEVVINVVNYDIVQQTSLSSTEYGDGVDEFVKAGFTKVASENIRPMRVKESPVQLECIVKDVVALGDQGGAGNLVICEVVKFHINEDILDENGVIDTKKIDLVARMGGNWYTRAIDGMFEVEKPLVTLGVGVDALPQSVVAQGFFTGNELGILGNIEIIPTQEEVEDYKLSNDTIQQWLNDKNTKEICMFAKECIKKGQVDQAWKVVLCAATIQ